MGDDDQLSEFGLISQLAPFLADSGDDVAVGHGDDAAVLELDGRLVAIAVDVVVEGVHFVRDVSAPEDVGWKAVAVNCSDLAAMGAEPHAAVVGLCRPAAVDADELARLYTGMREAADTWGLRLVGGDTVRADALALSVTVLGEFPDRRPVTRAGARPGDAAVVVGALGGAAAAVAALSVESEPDPRHLAAHRRPHALVGAGRVLAVGGATALIDVSDGLGADLGHVCTASGVGVRVRAADLPLADGLAEAAATLGLDPLELACGGGEDFALVAAAPPGRAAELARAAGEAEGVQAAVVGRFVEPGPGPAVLLELPGGAERDLGALGFDHFSERPER